jgi:molecular chaperone HscA
MAKISINIASGSIEKPKIVVGIDLGTTNSLVAYVPKGNQQAQIIPVRGNSIVPSVIHFDAHDLPAVGVYAKDKLLGEPERTIYSVKRLLGKNYKDVSVNALDLGYRIIDDESDNLVKVQIGTKFYNPIELSAEILKELKQQAELSLNATVEQAVITVPAYFNESQRQATRDAGKLAGLDVLRIVNEPTAASLAYGIQTESKGHILVYDFGGGTFDVSILQIEDGVFEVLATHGDTYLGGDDIDRAIVNHWREKASQENKEIGAFGALRHWAEKAKIQLSNDKSAQFSRDFEGSISLDLTYDELVKLAVPILDKTWNSVKKALKDADLKHTDIQEVVLVGGSTRFPLIEEYIKEWFHASRINNQINPDEVVALGAAIEADVLAGNRSDVLLLDVTPLSLGIETAGGLMDVLIPRNSKIPVRVGREYTTSVDGQVNLKVAVFQGERELVAENRKLGEFILQGIPSMPAGMPKIEIQFALNADGMLQVQAKELRSGVVQKVEIQPSYGLTDTQVEEMLLSGLMNAQTDVEERLLRESQNEARQIIYTTQRFIEKNANLLTQEEIAGTEQRMNAVRGLIEHSDRHQLQTAIETLNDFSRPFAERVMDIAVSKALKGNRIDQMK